MAVLQYVGARYVPKLFNDGSGAMEWQENTSYEPLTIVTYNSTSYISRIPVPNTIGAPPQNGNYWAESGQFNAQLADVSNRLIKLEDNVVWESPKKYGAYLDGVHDDTSYVLDALKAGSVKLPAGSKIKLNNLQIPDDRAIDFSGSEVYSDNIAIYLSPLIGGYARNISIKGINIKSGSGIVISEGYNIRISGLRHDVLDGTDFSVKILNSFNVSLSDCTIGTGNSNRSTSTGIVLTTGNPATPGNDNETNISIAHCLIQNLAIGIHLDNVTLADTVIFQDIGFSNMGIAITETGDSSQYRNINLSCIRVEFSDNAIKNIGEMSIAGIYLTRIYMVAIENSGNLVISGNLYAYNTSQAVLISNSSYLNMSGTLPTNIANFTLENSGTMLKPLIRAIGNSDFIDSSLNAYHMVTATTPSTSGDVKLPYPSGIGLNKNNSMVVCAYIAATAYNWYNLDITQDNEGISVNVPDISTLFNRPLRVFISSIYF